MRIKIFSPRSHEDTKGMRTEEGGLMETIDYAHPVRRESRWGKGFMAACASVMVWGMGHWLAGYARRGAGWLVTWVILSLVAVVLMAIPALSPAMLVIFPLTIVLTLAMFVDAFLC